MAHGRRRRRRDRVARAGDGRADRQAGPPRPARDGRDAARLGAGAAWKQRGVALDVAYLDGMGADVRGRMAELQAEIYPGGRRGVQPELAAAAPRDPVREAGALARQAHAEGAAVHGRERAREAARSSRRRCAPRLARAGQAQLHVPRGAAAAGRSARRPDPHVVQPGGGGDRTAVVVEPEPAEHPGPDGARPADPPGVHPGRRRVRCCSPRTIRRSSCGSSRTCPGTKGCAKRSRRATTSTPRRRRACSGSPRTRSIPPCARGRR